MTAYLPVPGAPDRFGWSDLETDISYLTDPRDQLDGLVAALVSAKREGDNG